VYLGFRHQEWVCLRQRHPRTCMHAHTGESIHRQQGTGY